MNQRSVFTDPARKLGALALIAGAPLVWGCLLTSPLPDPSPLTASGGATGVSGATQTAGNASGGSNGAPGCTSHRQCSEAHNDDPYMCRAFDGTCVPLITPECPLITDRTLALDQNAIFVGGFTELNRTEPLNSTAVYAIRLALDELNLRGGLPDGPNGARRPLVMSICYDDRATDKAMRFLTEELQVPAILAGFRQPQLLLTSFEQFQRGKVFFLSPLGGSKDLKQLKDNSLVWSLMGSPSDFAGIYRALLERLEKYVRLARGLSDTEPLRVASFQTLDGFSAELSDAAVPALRFNGVSAKANLDAGNYLPVAFDVATETQPDLDAKVKGILAFQPHVVLSFAGRPFTGDRQRSVLGMLQSLWSPDSERPYYVLSPLNDGTLEADGIESLVKSDSSVRPETIPHRRFLGIGSGLSADPTLLHEFEVHLSTRFPSAPRRTENFYDAVYFMAYAIFGAGQVGAPTAPEIASGMKRLVTGSVPIDVGPLPMSSVFSALSVTGGSLSLQGTLGPPIFEVGTGMRIDPGSVFCYDANAQLRRYALSYDLDARTLTGEFPCYEEF